MKLETVRLIKAGLADATNGIAAKIAALPLDGTDALPTNPTRYFDVDHKWLSRQKVSDEDTASISFPALAVYQHAPLSAVDPEVGTVVRDVDIQVAFAYLVKKADSAAALRDALYFNRAMLRWFGWFMSNDQSSGFRTKNGVIIRTARQLTQDDIERDWGSVNCMATTAATFRVRETITS